MHTLCKSLTGTNEPTSSLNGFYGLLSSRLHEQMVRKFDIIVKFTPDLVQTISGEVAIPLLQSFEA
jgi:hypothetical protein